MPSALWAASPVIQKFFSRPNPNFGQSAPVPAEPAPATRKPRPFPDGRGFLLRLGHTTAGFKEPRPNWSVAGERSLIRSSRTAAGGQTEFPYGCGRVALRA
jgi:hypothetical protein